MDIKMEETKFKQKKQNKMKNKKGNKIKIGSSVHLLQAS